MTYHLAIERARRALGAPVRLPSFEAVEAAVRSVSPRARPELGRRLLASGGALLATTALVVDTAVSLQLDAPSLVTLLVPVVGLVGSGLAVHRPGLSAQLFARAVWWAYLVLGVLWSASGPETLPMLGAFAALGCGVALLSAGGDGLMRVEGRTSFDPVALRGSIVASMIVALGDAQLLGLLAAVRIESGAIDVRALFEATCGMTLLVGAWGLFRLRFWAVVLNVVLSLGIAVAVVLSALSSVVLVLVGFGAAVHGWLLFRILRMRRRGISTRRTMPRWVRVVVGVLIMAAWLAVALGPVF